MELEGFEPSSKQATRKLSTCLFCVWFSIVNRAQTPNLRLIFFSFRALAEVSKTLFPHCYTPESDVAKQNFCGISYLLTIFGRALNPTVIRIKLQEQTLGRQLKFCDKGLKRSRHGSLHAYLPIDLAVETSQPQFCKTAKISKKLSKIKFIWA